MWVASSSVALLFLQMQIYHLATIYIFHKNHSFPVCFLATVTITSFKNSLSYIIQQTVPNLCFGPDALTDKILADCNFSRDLDLKINKLCHPNVVAVYEITERARQPRQREKDCPQQVVFSGTWTLLVFSTPLTSCVWRPSIQLP